MTQVKMNITEEIKQQLDVLLEMASNGDNEAIELLNKFKEATGSV